MVYTERCWRSFGISNIRELARNILTPDERIHVDKLYDESSRAWRALVRNPDNTNKKCTKLVAINESGLYTLIMRSTKPEAVKFRKWVTDDVIPEVMSTGSYTIPAFRTHEKTVSSLPQYLLGLESQSEPDLQEGYEEPTFDDNERVLGEIRIKIGNTMEIELPADAGGYKFLKALVKTYA